MTEWLKERWEAIKKWAVDDVTKVLYEKVKEHMTREMWIKVGLCIAIAIAAQHIPMLKMDVVRDALVAAAGLWGAKPASDKIGKGIDKVKEMMSKKSGKKD